MIKHVIFDLGNVLVHTHPERIMQEFARKCQIPEKQIRAFYLSDTHLGFMEGKYPPDEFYEIMMRKYPCNISKQDYIDIWNKVIGKPKDGIEEILRELKDNYLLSICSNTDPWHWKYVQENYSIVNYFQNYFLSFEIKMNKPNPDVFKQILAILNTSGNECVFIDDTKENTQSAEKFDINGIWASEPTDIRQKLQKLSLI